MSPRRQQHHPRDQRQRQYLRVNPIACEAHGMCAELLPERITLDEWGYPIVDQTTPLSPDLLDHARRAAQACPTFALLLLKAEREPMS
jgi:ferredoxin